jgi:hypothetical protein
MGRIAGNSLGYRFALIRETTVGDVITEHGFELPSVTTFIGEMLAKPPSAMAWWGYRVGLKAIAEAPDVIVDANTQEELEAALKERGVSPNLSRDAAGSRGSAAHEVLEHLAEGDREKADNLVIAEAFDFGTGYGKAAVAFWDEAVQPFIDSGEILQVRSEVPVWSLKNRYCGTLDLAIQWADTDHIDVPDAVGWEILDAKTHKPAKGFTLDGKGAGFISDAVQCRAYRMAWEEMGLGRTFGQRTIVLRETGKWLEDKREVSEEFVTFLRRLYDQRLSFEGGSK